MKTTNRILILMAVLSLMACKDENLAQKTDLKSQVQIDSVHVISLYVNTTDIKKTDSIEKDGIMVRPGLRKYANFDQASDISNEDYTINVRKGDVVIWRVVSITDSLDVVNINSINFQGGASLFGKNVLKGNGDVPEVVVGIVTKGPEKDNGTLLNSKKYLLKFTVFNNGIKRDNYKIDPKLQVIQ